MKIDDVIDAIAAKGSVTPDDIMRAITDIAESDITSEERGAILCGYMLGLTFALQKTTEETAIELLLRVQECELKGWV